MAVYYVGGSDMGNKMNISKSNQESLDEIITSLTKACVDRELISKIKLQIELMVHQAFIEGELNQLRMEY